jgi:hypothetical protein
MWFDKKIGDMELMQAIRYDNLNMKHTGSGFKTSG